MLARVQPIVPDELLLVVDGRTPFVVTTPPMVNAHGRPLDGRTCEIMILAERGNVEPIHNTLRGYSVSVGGGVYTRSFQPRALVQHLAYYAHKVVWVRATALGERSADWAVRVVWRSDLFPVEREQ